ncbi:hypothetical protein BDW62DRAFT_198713 [Aspergillus aurantiobrunneus]
MPIKELTFDLVGFVLCQEPIYNVFSLFYITSNMFWTRWLDDIIGADEDDDNW